MTPEDRQRYLHLLSRHSELSREYEAFLRELAESPEYWPARLPRPDIHGRTIYIERQCALARDEDGNLNFVTLPGQRANGLKELRDFAIDAASLIIVDPYVFSGNKDAAEKLADDFKRAARVGGKWLRRIHFVYNQTNASEAIRKHLKKIAEDAGVQVTDAHTDAIHDRVWIADRSRAIVVGTSLNGIGNRAAFLLPLPDYDLKVFLEFLDEHVLSRAQS